MSKSREWVKYIARDEDGTLWGFANDPAKNENGWSDNGNYMLIKETDDTYDYVKWSDNIAARVNQPLEETTPVKTISDDNLLNESTTGFHRLENEVTAGHSNGHHEDEKAIKPSHYRTGDKDLFDEWFDRYYHSEEIYTGREVFIAIMKSVAERYFRRYPNKNPEDLGKAIYSLERLKEYEERDSDD